MSTSLDPEGGTFGSELGPLKMSPVAVPRRSVEASTRDRCQLPFLPKWEILPAVRIIAKSSLQKFWERPGCADARGPLHSWYAEATKATWRSPQDIKGQYARASICGNNRVVFNIGGNKYRLVVEVQYRAGIVWVKFVGTHAQYDRIDVETVNDY